jgi:hypothetical protein
MQILPRSKVHVHVHVHAVKKKRQRDPVVLKVHFSFNPAAHTLVVILPEKVLVIDAAKGCWRQVCCRVGGHVLHRPVGIVLPGKPVVEIPVLFDL